MAKPIEDKIWAALTIYLEARGEPMEGKIAVAEVIRNRMKRRYSSDGTLVNTIFKPYQFSAWNMGVKPHVLHEIQAEDQAYQDCVLAWEVSKKTNLAKGAVLYYNPALASPNWAIKTDYLLSIANHDFHDERNT